jgi:hypothetical protein
MTSLIERLSTIYDIPADSLWTTMTHMFGVMLKGDKVLPQLIEDTQPYVSDINDKTSSPARALRFLKLLKATQNNKEMFLRIVFQMVDDKTELGLVTMMGIIAAYAGCFNLQNIMERAEGSEALRQREGAYLQEMNVLRDFYKITQFYQRDDESDEDGDDESVGDPSEEEHCDECGRNRLYWENEQAKAEKEDRLDDVEICWKCVMCGICGHGPASTGEVCESEECKKERSEAIPCDGCGMRYAPATYKQKGTCPKCVKLFAEMD